jgi:hypothetical protein
VDYTSALGLTLTTFLSLTDSFNAAPVVTPNENKFMQQTTPGSPTQVNIGAITISYSLSAVFGFC